MRNILVLEVNNKKYSGWQSINVSRDMENLTGSFSLGLVRGTGGVPIADVAEGDLCKIYIETDKGPVDKIPILTGYINNCNESVTADSTSLEVSGEDITQDLVECSAVKKSNSWTKATLVQIAEDLAKPFGIFVQDSTDSTKVFKNFTFEDGDKCFDVIERAARLEGVLPLTDRFGHLLLTVSADESSPTVRDLVEGYGKTNILGISRAKSSADRYSQYIVKGQNSGDGGGWTANTTAIKREAKDSGVQRHRPLVIVSEQKASGDLLQKRANWEAQVRAGRSTVFTVELKGWFIDPPEETSTPKPWQPNCLVHLTSEHYDFKGAQLVTSVNFTISETEGPKTTLELKDPTTYKANPQKEV